MCCVCELAECDGLGSLRWPKVPHRYYFMPNCCAGKQSEPNVVQRFDVSASLSLLNYCLAIIFASITTIFPSMCWRLSYLQQSNLLCSIFSGKVRIGLQFEINEWFDYIEFVVNHCQIVWYTVAVEAFFAASLSHFSLLRLLYVCDYCVAFVFLWKCCRHVIFSHG